MARVIRNFGKIFGESTDDHRQPDAGAPPAIWYAASEQKQRNKGDGDDDGTSADEGGTKQIEKKGEELKEDMDSLMDEIDSVLEENAEEFVKNYVQRGGQ